MVKRFSWKTFVIVAVIHFAGTVIILVLAAHSLGLYHQGVAQSRFAFQCLMVWAWIWSPLWMALSSRYSLHAGALVLLLWSPVVGALAGFIVPRIRRRRAKPSNQALQATAGREENYKGEIRK